jgi:neutral ceramidase
MSGWRRLVSSWLFLVPVAAVAAAASAPLAWQAGAARVDITPRESIWMAGFGSRTKPSEGVLQPLFARALALQDGAGHRAILVTLDLVGIERELADAVAAEARRRHGLNRDQLVLNVSHTHSGPVAGLVVMPLYDLGPEQRAAVDRYTSQLIAGILESIGGALAALAPARVEFGQGLAGIAVNRRRVRDRSLPGPVDHDVPVLAVRDPAGTLRAVAVGYAAHATAMNDYRINGDWPGFAMEEIERAHPGVTALFVNGCSADANPLPRRTEELARAYGRILAAAADEVLRSRMTPLRGPLRMAYETVDVPFETPPTREELGRRLRDQNPFVRLHARRLLEELDRRGALPTTYPYPVQVWQFESGQKLVALGGEVVVDYSLRLKQEHGYETTWVAGYSNDVLAYIPSRRVLKEGGYEGGDSMIYFGRPGRFGEAVEEIIVAKVAQLVRQTAAAPAAR